jgi:hypothetical protein
MIDLTKDWNSKRDYSGKPPFANAAWANDGTMCQWCAGTGHPHGDESQGICDCPDVSKNVDTPYHPAALCECGDPECLGPADAVIPVVEALAASLPQLQSPMLRLIQERNEARELVKRVLMATDGVTDSEEYYAAMLAAHRAVITWKGGAK